MVMQTKYMPTDKMSDIINSNSQILMAMCRFGISLGFGDKCVKEVCESQNVDCNTFLAVVNFISRKEYKCYKISLDSLMHYLKNAHSFFLDFNLPAIRRKLIDAIDCSESEGIGFLIIKFFDEYVKEVRKHMEHENRNVFRYVNILLRGSLCKNYNISIFESKHNSIDIKLKKLKDIIIRYYPQKDNELLNSVLFDIINCEQDLYFHCLIENCLFVPEVLSLEENLKNVKNAKKIEIESYEELYFPTDKSETLSEREKEIVACVARGMSNKEISEYLKLSINTVTTHRRNISLKLGIHSVAGITIFAIVNKLVKFDDNGILKSLNY